MNTSILFPHDEVNVRVSTFAIVQGGRVTGLFSSLEGAQEALANMLAWGIEAQVVAAQV